MTPEVLDSLKDSQLLKVGFAAESGSEETLKTVNKKINLSNMMNSMKYSNKIHIPSRCTIIYGFPGQTKKECWQNLKFAFKMAYLGVDEVSVFFFAPYPGSELHNQLVEKKLIPSKTHEAELYERFLDEMGFLNSDIRSWSENISPKQLKILFFLTHFAFNAFVYIFHPIKIFYSVKRIFKQKPATTLESVAYSLLNKKVLLRRNKSMTVKGTL
jgi:radical SAM superfamily enzyme YgiQ (UPF0313 family)